MSYKIQLFSQCQSSVINAVLNDSYDNLQIAKDLIQEKINTCAKQLEEQGVSYEIKCISEKEYYKIPREHNSPLNPIFYKSLTSTDYSVELSVFLED